MIEPKVEFVRDFMPFLIILKFYKVTIKYKWATSRTRANMGYFSKKGN